MDAEGTLQDVSFTDYEDMYKRWKMGRLTGDQVKAIGGPNLLDLMEAQWILDTETQAELMLPEIPVKPDDATDGVGGTSMPTTERDMEHGVQLEDDDKVEGSGVMQLTGEIYKSE